MSKGHYTLEFSGEKQPLYGTHSGGETVSKSMEVALGSRPATMVKVPSGSDEYRDLEIELEDRPADGIYLDSLIPRIIELNRAPLGADGTPGAAEDVQLVQWSDNNFTTERSRLKLTLAWVSDYKLPEGDRKAGEIRTMSVTFSHRGSEFTGA